MCVGGSGPAPQQVSYESVLDVDGVFVFVGVLVGDEVEDGFGVAFGGAMPFWTSSRMRS